MTLAELQQSMQTLILRGGDAIGQEILDDARASAEVRLGIYRSAYSARLLEVLAQTFPAVCSALGERGFAHLVSAFVHEHPSRFRSARDYGGQLPGYLAEFQPGARARTLSDLAAFEWALAAAFDALDHLALKPEQLASLDPSAWPCLRFTFAPCVVRIDIASNAVSWWRHACAGQARPTRFRGTCVQHWLLWRQDLSVYYRRLSRREASALDAAMGGQNFAQLCAALGDAAAAASLLHGWLSAGLIVTAQ